MASSSRPMLARVAGHVAPAPLHTSGHPANVSMGHGRGRQLRVLTEPQLQLFWENGFLVVEDLLSGQEVAALAQRCDRIAAGAVDNISPAKVQLEPEVAEQLAVEGSTRLSPAEQVFAVRKLFNLCDTDGVMFGHASNRKLVDVVADLLGESVS